MFLWICVSSTFVELRLVSAILLDLVCVTDHCCFKVTLCDEIDQSTNEQECNLDQSTKIPEELKHTADRAEVELLRSTLADENLRQHGVRGVNNLIVLAHMIELETIDWFFRRLEFDELIVQLNLSLTVE